MDCVKVGKLILQLRREKGLTQKQVADQLNISNKTISKWERGMGCPDLSLLPELSDIFQVGLDQLLTGELDAREALGGNMKKTAFYICPDCGNVPVPEEELPLRLPEVESYEPTGTGESPLAGIEEWVNCKCPVCGKAAKRETNTMPQWAGSSWYFLRYVDNHNDKELVSREKADALLPVDMYIGGVEHAVLHLLYSRCNDRCIHHRSFLCHTQNVKKRRRQSHESILPFF